jgi:hypothetical protein
LVPVRRAIDTRCEFCGVELPDLMLGFMDHIDASPQCRLRWDEWRANVRRESGGT